jgi:pimeloyl-ACP methyl ester carboxylesterase
MLHSSSLNASRRRLLVAAGSIAVCAAPFAASAQADRKPKNFVLVHGSWHGGWCWSRVAAALAQKQHRVFAVTQTGLGDRRHLAGAATHIDVFVDDIVNAIESEELDDVVLVGHSFGGIPVTGAAARIPNRIRSLVYLDAGVPDVGESAISPLSPPEQERRRQSAVRVEGVEVLTAPTTLPAYWGVAGTDADWVLRRLTPHPFATFITPLQYDKDSWEKIIRGPISSARRHITPRSVKVRPNFVRIRDGSGSSFLPATMRWFPIPLNWPVFWSRSEQFRAAIAPLLGQRPQLWSQP